MRKILAALAGYVAIGILVVLSDRITSSALAAPSTKYFAVTLFTDVVYTIVGGFLCAKIAGAGAREATIGLIVFGEAMGITSAIVAWSTQPHWFGLALLILYPPAIWIGSKLAPRRMAQTAV